jgi:DNA-binding HxlR family transcriptional regulator
MSARSVSGSMRKLVTEQYVEKVGQNPVTYKLTDLGETLAKELQVDKD